MLADKKLSGPLAAPLLVVGKAFAACIRAIISLLYFLGLGLPREIATGRIRLRASFGGALLLGLSFFAGVRATQAESLYGIGTEFAWAGGLLGGALAMGLLLGFFCRAVVYWEAYLGCLLVGVPAWLGLGGRPAPRTMQSLSPRILMPLGADILGPMWERVLGMSFVGALVLAVAASSITFLICGASGRVDAAGGLMRMVVVGHTRSRSKNLVKTTTAVAMLGVALGVGALIAVTAVMSGYQDDIQSKILSTNAHLVIQKYGLDFTEHPKVVAQAKELPEVIAAQPFTFNEAMLHAEGRSHGVLVKGIVPATQVTHLARDLCRPVKAENSDGPCRPYGPGAEGLAALTSLFNDASNGAPPALVGEALFKKLGLPLGGTFLMMTPVAMAGGRADVPHRLAYRIAGTFRSGMHEFDSRLVYLNLSEAQTLFAMQNTVSGVELRLSSPDLVSRVAERVLFKLQGYPYRVLDWKELNQGIFTALKMQKVVMFLVLLCIVIVASFNIASTLLMAVIEKREEVAILKSMGAKDHHICQIFVAQGWLTGLFGIALGIVFGVGVSAFLSWANIGLASDVYMVGTLRIQIRSSEIAGTALAALLIVHLATLVPALRAARARPVDALRGE